MYLESGIIAFILLIIAKIYLLLTTKYCKNHVSLIGKTVIITGANSGLGFGTALELAKRGAKIILACRNVTKAQKALEKIVNLTQNHEITLELIDMESLKSVRKFADKINQNETRLDILINNAGSFNCPYGKTDDGLEKIMQINYFAPFFLTNLLTEKMKKTPGSRIIFVSSIMARLFGRLNWHEMNMCHFNYFTYGNAKLYQILYTKELAKRLNGSGVSVFSLHPGVVQTNIMDDSIWGYWCFKFIAPFLLKNTVEGCQTIVYAATERNLAQYSGGHFHECGLVADYPEIKRCLKDTKKLWIETEKLIQTNSPSTNSK